LERYYKDKTGLVELTIDSDLLNQRLQDDYSPSMNESFPHVYGRINLDAVVHVREL